jgi:hypothetical protein
MRKPAAPISGFFSGITGRPDTLQATGGGNPASFTCTTTETDPPSTGGPFFHPGRENSLKPAQEKIFQEKNAFDSGHVVPFGVGVFSSHHRGRSEAMNLKENLGTAQIKDVIETHPRIGEILNKYEIGCVTCGVGICLLGDVVAIHALGAELEQKIEEEINEYLDNQ